MFRTLIVACAIAVGGGVVLAQSNAIADRQASMKRMGAAAGPIGQMLQGKAPFELAKVKESLGAFAKEAKTSAGLFPAGSTTGEKTAALPAIWEKKAEFDAIFTKLEKDANDAAAAITDEASFKANAGKVLQNCGGCHQTYRAKQS